MDPGAVEALRAIPGIAGFHYREEEGIEGYTPAAEQQRAYAILKAFFPDALVLYATRLDPIATDPLYLDGYFRPEFSDLVAPYFYPIGTTVLGDFGEGDGWEDAPRLAARADRCANAPGQGSPSRHPGLRAGRLSGGPRNRPAAARRLPPVLARRAGRRGVLVGRGRRRPPPRPRLPSGPAERIPAALRGPASETLDPHRAGAGRGFKRSLTRRESGLVQPPASGTPRIQSPAVTTPDPIPMLDLTRYDARLNEQIARAVAEVFRTGRFVLGPANEEFESRLAAMLGTRHAVGVSSGTDALLSR